MRDYYIGLEFVPLYPEATLVQAWVKQQKHIMPWRKEPNKNMDGLHDCVT